MIPVTTTLPPTISRVSANDMPRHFSALAELLHACVHAGASVGFVLPFSMGESIQFWRERVHPAVMGNKRILFIAEIDAKIVGTVQLDFDTFPNQPHRADVMKLLVHPHIRRRGIATELMVALELQAKGLERTLLTLDTRTGDAAEPLYSGLGYETVGPIPGYCKDPQDDRWDATTIMYKHL